MKVYKVVRRRENGELVSVWAYGKAEVKYKPGKWVQAPRWLRRLGYHLLVFNEFKTAKSWCNGPGTEIWEAEADKFMPIPIMLDVIALSRKQVIEVNKTFPRGTVMVRKLKLLRKVYDFDCKICY